MLRWFLKNPLYLCLWEGSTQQALLLNSRLSKNPISRRSFAKLEGAVASATLAWIRCPSTEAGQQTAIQERQTMVPWLSGPPPAFLAFLVAISPYWG